MLKNVLEANGFLIRENVWGYEEETDFFEIVPPEQMEKYNNIFKDRKGRMDENYLFVGAYRLPNNLEYHIEDFDEFVCKQYVRENGFKLEWLDFPRYRVALHHWYRIKEECGEVNMGKVLKELLNRDINNSVFKDVIQLIAWLYSEDIKIVEE